MDRLFIVGFDNNGYYDQRDIDRINNYLDSNSNREITKAKVMPNGEILIIVTD